MPLREQQPNPDTGRPTLPASPAAHTLPAPQVLLEFSFAWASKMEVKLLVTLLGGQRERTNPLRTVLSSVSRVKVRRGTAAGVQGRLLGALGAVAAVQGRSRGLLPGWRQAPRVPRSSSPAA